MLKCRLCGCNCDPADTVNGVCDDCREAEEQKNERERIMWQMLHDDCEQMELLL